jgi:hypothetical protein
MTALRIGCRLLISLSFGLLLLQSLPAKAQPVHYYGQPMPAAEDPASAGREYQSNLDDERAERDRLSREIQSLAAQEKSLEAEIAMLEREQKGGRLRANDAARQIAQRRGLQMQTRQSEQAYRNNLAVVDRWIGYWQSKLQTIQWNAQQDTLNAQTAASQALQAATYQDLEAQTAIGSKQWKQTNRRADHPVFLEGDIPSRVVPAGGWGSSPGWRGVLKKALAAMQAVIG